MAHRASPLAHTVFFLVIFALVTSDGRAQTLHEQGRRTFPKMVQVLKNSYKGNYENTVIKNDTFIFQKTVVIDELLVTNGGDVLIVADELFLNAPIDTRIRFRMGPDYWLSPNAAEVGQQYGLGQVENIQYHLGALKAFDSLYLWRETYDPKGKKFVYEVAPRPESRPKAPSIVAELPQLPSAQVPLASRTEYAHRYDSTRPSDGADAPDGDVIWENVRSGNIRIFASKIHLCEECKNALANIYVFNRSTLKPSLIQRARENPPRFPFHVSARREEPAFSKNVTGDPFDVVRSVFLQASGLKGGRGAAGSTHYGAYGNLGAAGGLSGRPGRGGDAGNIEVHFVNDNQKIAELRDLFDQGAALVEGGEPAQSHRQRTPSVSTLEASQDRSAFVDEVPIADFENLRGKPGAITVDVIDTDTAIRSISARLVEAELTSNYARPLDFKRSVDPNSIFHFTG